MRVAHAAFQRVRVALIALSAASFVACATQQEEPEARSILASQDAAADRAVQNLAPFQGVWIMEEESEPGTYVCKGTMLVMRSAPAGKPEIRLNCLDAATNLPTAFPFDDVAGRQVFADVNGATGTVRAPSGPSRAAETYYATLLPGPLLIQTSIFPAVGMTRGRTVTTQTMRLENGLLTYEYAVQGTSAEPRRVTFSRRP